MTPTEARNFCRQFERTIGPRAKVWMSLTDRLDEKNALDISIYRNWPGSDAEVKFKCDDFEEACLLVEKNWQARKLELDEAHIKRLAIEIIKITDAKGTCTEADLRCLYYFSDKDVTEFGPAACDVANRMAGRGPFAITKTPGGNGAPSEMILES